jgi:hypothetical protein
VHTQLGVGSGVLADVDAICFECGSGDEVAGNEILLCDGKDCYAAFHLKCLGGRLTEVRRRPFPAARSVRGWAEDGGRFLAGTGRGLALSFV